MSHSLIDFVRPVERGLRGNSMWLPAGVAICALRKNTLFFFEVAESVQVRNSPNTTPVFIEPGTLFSPKFDVTKYGYTKFLLSECRLLTAIEYGQYRKLPLV